MGEHVEHRALQLQDRAHRTGEHAHRLARRDDRTVGHRVSQRDRSTEHGGEGRLGGLDEDGADGIDTGDHATGPGDQQAASGLAPRNGGQRRGVPVGEVLRQGGPGKGGEQGGCAAQVAQRGGVGETLISREHLPTRSLGNRHGGQTYSPPPGFPTAIIRSTA